MLSSLLQQETKSISTHHATTTAPPKKHYDQHPVYNPLFYHHNPIQKKSVQPCIQRVKVISIEHHPLFGSGPASSFLSEKCVNDVSMHYLYQMGEHNVMSSEISRLAPGDPDFLLAPNEPLVLISHGSPPKAMFAPRFGGYTPESLATHLFTTLHMLPPNYTGEIFIDGCNTATGKDAPGDATSYIGRFKAALANLLGQNGFHVRGNIGTASTDPDDGREKMTPNNKEMAALLRHRYEQRIIANNPTQFNPTEMLSPNPVKEPLFGFFSPVCYKGECAQEVI